jgi:ribosomal protein S18 acetylase RimI-like enzyme
MKIRKAKKEDLKDLAELDKQFWEIHSSIDPFIEPAKKLTSKDHLKSARDFINSKEKNKFKFVAELDGKVVASVNFEIQKNNKFFKVKKFGYLDAITVNKKYRGKGIGKELTKFVLNFLKKKGIGFVKFHTNWENKNAIKAFRKMKFKEKNIMFYKELK